MYKQIYKQINPIYVDNLYIRIPKCIVNVP